MADPTEFLTARWDEEQRIAEAAAHRDAHWYRVETPFEWGVIQDAAVCASGKPIVHSSQEYDSGLSLDHIAYWDPARVLADIAAKRALLELHSDDGGHDCPEIVSDHPKGRWVYHGWVSRPDVCETVKALIQPFRDHPDFDPAWAVQP